jgi:hypothetical protein
MLLIVESNLIRTSLHEVAGNSFALEILDFLGVDLVPFSAIVI